MNIKDFYKQPLLGILRGIEMKMLEPLADTIISSGINTVEITMNTKNASALIKKMKLYADKKLTIGAGTVLNMTDMDKALNAGATFIVMPVLIKNIMKYCSKNNIPVFPGALTPQEIHKAWDSGATMVKVFPAKFFGPSYFKEIKAPLNNIRLMACGGVSTNNINEFFSNGADAVSFGASIFRKDLLKEGNYKEINKNLKLIVKEYNKVKNHD